MVGSIVFLVWQILVQCDFWEVYWYVECDVDVVGEQVECYMCEDFDDLFIVEVGCMQCLNIVVGNLCMLFDYFQCEFQCSGGCWVVGLFGLCGGYLFIVDVGFVVQCGVCGQVVCVGIVVGDGYGDLFVQQW